MIVNGQRMLIQITVKQPISPGQHWWVSAPVKIPEDSATSGRGIAFTPGNLQSCSKWVITTATVDFCHAVVHDLIAKETSGQRAAVIQWNRMVNELIRSNPGAPVA